jgi:hypothetical protein
VLLLDGLSPEPRELLDVGGPAGPVTGSEDLPEEGKEPLRATG